MITYCECDCYCGLFQHLKLQQEGLKHLIDIINDDCDDLKVIERSLAETVKLRRWQLDILTI